MDTNIEAAIKDLEHWRDTNTEKGVTKIPFADIDNDIKQIKQCLENAPDKNTREINKAIENLEHWRDTNTDTEYNITWIPDSIITREVSRIKQYFKKEQ